MPDESSIITVSLNPAIDRAIEVKNFEIGRHQQGRQVSRTPGGKAVNVSRVLAALGVGSIATGFLGGENRGTFAPVFADGLTRDEFFVLDGWTRENVTIADPVAACETHIRDVGLEVGPASLDRLSRKLGLLSRDGGIVVLSGSLPRGIGPAEFAELADVCIEAGARLAVDTSGPALQAVAGKSLWLVKPNTVELAQIVGRELNGEDDQLAAARKLAERIEMVLLSRGERGACLFTAGRAVRASAAIDAQRIRNTVGCGDALLAAFVAGLARSHTPDDALRDAVACATASACDMRTATFSAETLSELRGKVDLTEL